MKNEVQGQKDEMKTEGGLTDRADETLLGEVDTRKEARNNFLTDLAEVMKKHKAILCVDSESVGYSGHHANLTFDINTENHDHTSSYGTNIVHEVITSIDINSEDIRKLIR